MLAPVTGKLAQFPLWHWTLLWHDPPLDVRVTQLPAPSQIWFVPQVLPCIAFDWLQTTAPVVQLIVPGLQVVPQAMLAVHAIQAPVGSQTWFVPQVSPGAIFFWLAQTGVPELQSKVPGLHVDPHAAPLAHVTQPPFPSHTWLPPQEVPGNAFC